MKAAHGHVADVRKVPSQSVCKVIIEFPIEAYVALVAFLDSQKVLVTISTLEVAYGIVDSGQETIKEPQTPPTVTDTQKSPVGLINKPQLRGYCGLAIDLCKLPSFYDFMLQKYREIYSRVHLTGTREQFCKEAIMLICGCEESRKELDSNEECGRLFEKLIRQPWQNSPHNKEEKV